MRRGGLGGLGLRFGAGGLRAGEGGGHIEGEAGALKRQVREVEPHLLAGDVLHLGEIGADALDEVRLAGSGAAAPVRRAGEEGLGDAVAPCPALRRPATAASSELAASAPPSASCARPISRWPKPMSVKAQALAE